jgi:hypothetical protein
MVQIISFSQLKIVRNEYASHLPKPNPGASHLPEPDPGNGKNRIMGFYIPRT